MTTTIKAREIEVDLIAAKGLHTYTYCVWQFSNGIILVHESDRPESAYFGCGLECLNVVRIQLKDFGYTGKIREFKPLDLARLIQSSIKAYGYGLAHFKAWQLVRLTMAANPIETIKSIKQIGNQDDITRHKA